MYSNYNHKSWKPKFDEWCWFWNEDFEIPFLEQFKGTTASGDAFLHNRHQCRYSSKNCEQYLKGLPTIIERRKVNETK